MANPTELINQSMASRFVDANQYPVPEALFEQTGGKKKSRASPKKAAARKHSPKRASPKKAAARKHSPKRASPKKAAARKH
jgi:hypothetical protein